MGLSTKCLLLAVAVLLVTLVDQSASHGHKLTEKASKEFPNAKKKFDIKAALGGDGNIVIEMGTKAVQKIHEYAEKSIRPGLIGQAIKVFTEGWEETLKMVANALDDAFDVIDYLMEADIKDKTAAVAAINNGMNDVRSLVYRSGIPVHSCLGAGKSMANITDRGEFKHAIEKIEETATGIFEDIDAAQFFASQGIKSSEIEVTKKCLRAAHAAIKSAAETAYTNFVAGSISAVDYLSNSDEETIRKHEPVEEEISHSAKHAAAHDSDTVSALKALNREFVSAERAGNNVDILEEVKEGLVEYIEHSAWSVAICYEALEKAKLIYEDNQDEAINMIEKAVKKAKTILIDGSVKAYEALGSAGRALGSRSVFEDAIEIAEISRMEGTKGFESAKMVAERGILTGGLAAIHALDAAHTMFEANEACIFGYMHEVRHKTFDALKADVEETDLFVDQ